MRKFVPAFACLLALTINPAARAAVGNSHFSAAGTPPGFDALAAPRVALVDLYFGGRKVGEALAEISPGFLKFKSPAEVLAAVPGTKASPILEERFADELPTNSAALCSLSKTTGCGVIAPDVAGIIYDEDRFRVDLFVNPRFLKTVTGGATEFLPIPTAPVSLTSAIGLAAGGAVGGRSSYNIQNRTVLGLRNARIRTSNSLASGLGWVVDDLAGEVDTHALRYSAGLFWAPGSDLIGERRMIGAGVGTQFDTRADPDAVRGTPLILFLSQPARVELLVDGRLASSRSYDAGNQELDTSALPDGSYPVQLRIHDQSGSVREEQRFFVKNPSIAPMGHPIYFAYAGLLANTRPHHPIDPSRTLFYQAGTAVRMKNWLALDAAVIGTQDKAMAEVGGWLLGPPARLRLATLASTSGDAGLLVQLSSNPGGVLNASFDLRRVWSHDGSPLIPLPGHLDSFGSDQPVGAQLATGSYTQAVASLGVRLGGGSLSVLGSYRRDSGQRSDYSIGPSLDLPVVTRGGLQLTFQVSGQRSRNATAAFAGLRILSVAGPVSVSGSLGRSVEDIRGDSADDASRATGSVTVQYSAESGGALMTADAGATRDLHSSSIRGGATVSSRLGNARADVLHGLEGQSGTQYDVAIQSGLAISPRSATFGARQAEPSAIIVSVHGDAPGASFDVLVDGAPRGQVRIGQRLSLFVPGYRTYRVRLVPRDAAAVDVDSAPRDVTLYPGNVQPLDWTVASYTTLVAQAVSTDGAPIADALVQSAKSVGETDSSGFFQLDVRSGDAVTIVRGGSTCEVALPKLAVHKEFASVGKVTCQ